jgi:hypothetical protein
MRKRLVWVACATVLVITSGTASAQYAAKPPSSGVSGADYRAELTYSLWNPTPTIRISSESLGIVGTDIDAVADLGFEKNVFQDFRVVLGATKRLKFRFGYTPIKYEGDTTLIRTIVFNGQRYRVGLPVVSSLDWKSWRAGLEYDFISNPRGFFGFILEGKFTELDAQLTAPLIDEFTHVKVPIPTVGAVGRVYAARNLAITGELTGFKLTIQDNSGEYVDFDLNAMYTFTRNIGVVGGYRTLYLDYGVEQDAGDLKLKGLYFGAVARF